jgi:TM2 domain-containing membrane protein YozV
MKSKVTAAVLAFFLGGIGVHRFYLGDNGLGLLYLLMSWTLIPAFIAFLEAFYFLLMNDQVFNQRYNMQHAGYLPQHSSPQQIGQNVTVNIPSQGASGQQINVADQLGKLNELRIAGAITDAEFQSQKRKLLT